MASTQQLMVLFEALKLRDVDAARAVAEEIAAESERLGHVSAARTLRSALRADGHALVAPGRAGELPEALARVPITVTLADVELPATTRRVLDELVLESKHALELAERGIPRRTRLLLSGPPGVGKSLTARALGGSIGLPVFVVRLDALIGALLGQTSSRLHGVFRYVERVPCVLLLDELDAIGRQRGDRLDVAELDRVVVGLMQELDYARIPGLLVATTNFIAAVDPALARRFDTELELRRPTERQRSEFLRKRAQVLGITRTAALNKRLGPNASFADVERVVLNEARRRALAELTTGPTGASKG